MKKNRIRICGRKTSTPPAPATMPSTSRLRNTPSGRWTRSHAPTAPTPASMASMGTAAQLNTAWNIRNMVPASSSMPHSGCSTTRSMASSRCGRCSGSCTARRMMRRASCCVCSTCAGPCACQGRGCTVPGGRQPSSHCTSSRAPPLRMPTVSTTGMPSSRSSTARSMAMPARRAASLMFSASTMGRPMARVSSTMRRPSCRRVASTTHTSSPGVPSPARWPVITSRVTASSELSALRL